MLRPDADALLVALLAYNEERAIGPVISEMQALGYRTLVVDDGSEDRTARRARKAGARVVRHETNRGYGAAIRTALSQEGADWILLLDGDGQFPAEAVRRLWAERAGCDAVWGIRRVRADSTMRRLTGRAWQALCRLLTAVPLSDVDCGAKLVRADAVRGLTLTCDGPGVSLELALALRKEGAVIREVSVPHRPRIGGRATGLRPSVVVRGARELFDVARRYGDGGDIVRRLVRFALAGGLNTTLDGALYALGIACALTLWAHLTPAVIAALSLGTYGAGGLLGYQLSRRWTFPHRVGRSVRYALQVLGLGLLNAGFSALFAGTHPGSASALLAKAAALGLTGLASFILQNSWVFHAVPSEEVETPGDGWVPTLPPR